VKRLAILLVIAACSGGGKKATSGAGTGSGPAIYAKKIVMSWGLQKHDQGADVFLQVTDETGAMKSYPLGTYEGDCKVITPAPEMKAVSAVACNRPATGVEIDAVTTDEEIIILKVNTQSGVAPDPMSRQELTRVKAPGGAAIESGT
jgi:hypothetical protein